MPQSLSKIFLHLVFSTLDRKNYITDEVSRELYPYIARVLLNLNCMVHQIGGTENHVHILLELSRNISVSKMVGAAKAHSSRWLKSRFDHTKDFAWQSGYGIFSIDRLRYLSVKDYILTQKLHHKQFDFKEEYLSLLREANVTFNEAYLWD